eukprot:448802_1
MPRFPEWKERFKYAIQERTKQCVICNAFTQPHQLKSITATRSLFIYYNKQILLHPDKDKLCSGDNSCSRKSNQELLTIIAANENIIESSIAEDTSKRIVQNLAALVRSRFFATTLKDKFDPQKQRTFSFENNSDIGVETICNKNKTQINGYSKFIIKKIKSTGLRLTGVLDTIDKNRKNDSAVVPLEVLLDHKEDEKEEEESKITESELNRVNNCIYIFLIKSKTKLNNKILGVYHQYHKDWIGKLFHKGRVLIWTFLAPFYFGAAHLTRQQLLQKQSNWARLINQLTGKYMVMLGDGMKIRQHRFRGNFGHSYNSFDPGKKYHTRGYMGLSTTTGYNIDLMGGFCTNGSHGDSHDWNWITQHNHNKINNLLNADTDLIGFDRGFKYILPYTIYWVILPSLKKTKPIDTFLINCSRLLTQIRWIIEACFGHYKMGWKIFAETIIHNYRKYIDSWLKSLVALDNFDKPNGWVTDFDEDTAFINYFRYQIKHEFFQNDLESDVNKLEDITNDINRDFSEHNEQDIWHTISEQEGKSIVPGFDLVELWLEDEHILLYSGGNYGYNLKEGYLRQNQYGDNITMSVHGEQVKILDWRWENERINRLLQFATTEDEKAELLTRRRQANEDAIRDNVYNEYKYIVIRFENIRSRMTRDNDNSKTYTVYVAIDTKQYYNDTLQLDGMELDNNNQNTGNRMEVDEIKNDESLSDIINNPFDIVQSVDNVNELGEITIDFKVPDELGDDEKATETLAGIQERMLRKLITKDRIEQLEYDDDKIPLIVKCIKSMCTCGHGTRTLGCCAHRTTIWQLLRDSLRGNNMEEPHTDCTAQGNILINIENDHEWIRAEPKGLNSDTEDDGYDGNRSRFRNHNNL